MEGESPADWPFHPFCSDRCRLIDLGRWLGESYGLPQEAERRGVESPEELPESP
jgi:endogenous inhibitor of DNA gyrase (YacG/DUF329 family)